MVSVWCCYQMFLCVSVCFRLSLSFSEKNPSFPAVFNISLTCSHSDISSTDWTLFLQTLCKAGKLSEEWEKYSFCHYSIYLISSFTVIQTCCGKYIFLQLFSSWGSFQDNFAYVFISLCGFEDIGSEVVQSERELGFWDHFPHPDLHQSTGAQVRGFV